VVVGHSLEFLVGLERGKTVADDIVSAVENKTKKRVDKKLQIYTSKLSCY